MTRTLPGIFLILMLSAYTSRGFALPTQSPMPLPNQLAPASQITQPAPAKDTNKGNAASLTDIIDSDNLYGFAGSNFSFNAETKQDPSGVRELGDMKYSLGIYGLIGLGPVNIKNITFSLHYAYEQNWGTDPGQISVFLNEWIANPKTDSFIFPTRSLIRTHDFVGDIRVKTFPSFGGWTLQSGFFGRLATKRQGSSMLGEPNEQAQTVRLSENFIPYLLMQYEKSLILQLSVPFKTEINREDPSLSNATYSWSDKGRGRLFSVLLNTEYAIARIQSFLYADIYYYQYKYSSLTYDFNRPGLAISFDFPIYHNLRAVPKATYMQDSYYLQKVRIDKNRKGGWDSSSETTNAAAKEYDWIDNRYTLGFSVYYDMDEQKQHRIFTEYSYAATTSTITEYNASVTFFSLGYCWAIPGVTPVKRKYFRFRESIYGNEF